jgi:hypothetical protein
MLFGASLFGSGDLQTSIIAIGVSIAAAAAVAEQHTVAAA